MDDIDKTLLNLLQKEFPLSQRPFLAVAEKCGISEAEVLGRVQRLKEDGIIRRIGAVFNGAKLGRVSTLCAARVPESKMDIFVQVVNSSRGVTHNYRRDDEYNVWFTVSAATGEELETFLAFVKEKTGVTDILNMQAITTFKINATFAM